MFQNYKKKFNKFIDSAIIACLVLVGGLSGIVVSSQAFCLKASKDADEERVLLQRDNMLSSIVKFKKGVNPFTSKAKVVAIENMGTEKIKALINGGYTIDINDTHTTAEGLPEPITVKDKVIYISTYSTNGDIVDFINELVG